MEDIHCVAKSIKFKEYLLNRDVQSRRVVLNTAIRFMEETNDEKKVQVIAWLRNILSLNEMPGQERKESMRFDVFWDELHSELCKSEWFYIMMRDFGC
jgi:hypothetical protein